MLIRLSYANHVHCPAVCAAYWRPAVNVCIQGSVLVAENAKKSPRERCNTSAGRLSSSGKAGTTVQTAATAAAQDLAVQEDFSANNQPSDAEGARAYQTLKALGKYSPSGLSDGPASLSRILPYNAAVYEQALQHGLQLLHAFTVYRLSNIAAALAAAGHVEEHFLRQLGDEATQQLQNAPAVQDNAAAVAQLKAISYLAVAYARVGMVHVELLTQIAVSGAKLLLRGCFRPSKRLHSQYIAQLAAAYAALKLHPPQLFRAIGELLKQQRQVISLLGPHESMLLLWAFGKVGHKDPPAELLLTQRTATQVGQLDCKGLAHAYIQCAQANLTAPPLLAALRKATRQRLPAMSPQDLTALLTALAALGQQDSLFLDEVAKAVLNKLMNFTTAQISSTISALSLLSYRNPWLLEHASKVLVSIRLNKAAQLTATQLADLLLALSELRYHNTRLFDHLGSVVAKNQTLTSWSASELSAVLQGFGMLGFSQPVLLEAAAVRLRQLASVSRVKTIQQQQQPALQLINAACQLASLRISGSGAVEHSTVAAATVAVAAAALEQQQLCSCTDWIKLSIALLLGSAQQHELAAASTSDLQASAVAAEQGNIEASHMPQHIPVAATGALQQQQQQQHERAGAAALLPQLLQHVQSGAQAAAEAAIADNVQQSGPELLCLMQLLWLREVQRRTGQEAAAHQQGTAEVQQGLSSKQTPSQQQLQNRFAAAVAQQEQQYIDAQQPEPVTAARRAAAQAWRQQQQEQQQARQIWQLGLSDQVLESFLLLHLNKYSQRHDQQQQQEPAQDLELLRTTLLTIQQQLHALDVDVQAPYRIPGSPMILPAAVIPKRSARRLVNTGRPVAANSRSSNRSKGTRSRSTIDSQGDQVESAAAHVQQHQELQQPQQRAVTASFQLQQGRVQLPSGVLSQLKYWAANEVPFGVFMRTQGPGGLSGWFSSSLPAELLPVAAHWDEGLTCAGWGLLLLDLQPEI